VVRPGRKIGTRRAARRESVVIARVGWAGRAGRAGRAGGGGGGGGRPAAKFIIIVVAVAAVVVAVAVEEDILQTVSIVTGQ
jgi:hypothetical protein